MPNSTKKVHKKIYADKVTKCAGIKMNKCLVRLIKKIPESESKVELVYSSSV